MHDASCGLFATAELLVIITQTKSWYSFYRPTEGRRLSWPSWLVTYRDDLPTHPGTNWVWFSATTLIKANTLPVDHVNCTSDNLKKTIGQPQTLQCTSFLSQIAAGDFETCRPKRCGPTVSCCVWSLSILTDGVASLTPPWKTMANIYHTNCKWLAI